MQQEAEAWLRSVRDGRAWRGLPNESSPKFFAVGIRVSMAVQAALRRAIGAYYFNSPEAYRNYRYAYRVMVYSLSPVSNGRPRTDFTYDIHSPKTIRSATNGIDAVMAKAMGAIEKQMTDAGDLDAATYYMPHRARRVVYMVRTKYPKALLAMLLSDDVIVTATIQLLALAAEIRDERDRRENRVRAIAAAYVKALHRRLRKFHPGINLVPLGPELFSAAINAAREAIAPDAKPLPVPSCSPAMDLAA